MTKRPYNQEDIELLLLDYAAGVLNEAQRLFVDSYIAMSKDAQDFVAHCEKLGGLLIETHCPPVRMSKHSLNAVLERLEHPSQSEKTQAKRAVDELSVSEALGIAEFVPAELQRALCRRLSSANSWKTILPGVKILSIPVEHGHSRVALIKCAPKAKIPFHEHRARELSLVLNGSFSDCYGHHQKGDILICDSGTGHSPQADPESGCLVLNTVDAPVRHKGFYAYLNIIIRH